MISVIVPVYNTEKYIHRCIDSILAQSHTDFELLLIDDGSPDNCGVICDDYAAQDTRVRVFHKGNGGVSSARNLGIEQAQGEWITFIDSDDYVHQDFLLSLYKKHDVDLIISSFKVVGSSEDMVGYLEDIVYDEETLRGTIESLALTVNFHTPWGKLFRRDIIVNSRLVFDEQINSGEDALFVFNYLMFTRTLRLSNKVFYFYERGNSGGLSQHFNDIEHDFYAMDKYSLILSKLEKNFNCNLKYLYMVCMKGYCSKQISYLYHKKDGVVNKYKQLNLMCQNQHLRLLFSEKQTANRKKIVLFHFLMSRSLCLIALLYIYIFKGKVY